MKFLARRKVVLVIVEGPTDEAALGVALEQIFDRNTVRVEVIHGDITTRQGVFSDGIVAELGNVVKTFMGFWNLNSSDFKQIIHIVDTDGVYIPNDKIYENNSLKEVHYTEDGVHTPDRFRIIKRNEQKKENLYKLRTRGTIVNIPYRIYYMSCNLDHVLHDKRNSSDDEKETDSHRFAKRYKEDVQSFIDFICKSEFSITDNYKESWKMIESDLNSLSRYTNLGICLNEELNEKEKSKMNKKKPEIISD